LHGDPVRQAAREPEGLTGAIRPADGPVIVSFEPGSAELPWPDLGALNEGMAALLVQEGRSIMIDASGAAQHSRDTMRVLDNLSLGLRRASAIADFLISRGVQPDRIKLRVMAGEAAGGSALSVPDTAQIILQPAR
jgi:hypothetical protein